MVRPTKIAVAALIYMATQGALAASFDCTRAVSKTEKLICSNAELSFLDEKLGAAYKSAYSRVKNKLELRQSQRNWLASHEMTSCDDPVCLKRNISERIGLLQEVSASGKLPLGWTASCVKVRDGTHDAGPTGGYACMKFSESEKQAAAKMQLQLTSSYDVVRSHLKENAWTLDPEWLRTLGPHEKSQLPVCGQGRDATCHIQVVKGEKRALLIFSGTNAGTPLISVDTP